MASAFFDDWWWEVGQKVIGDKRRFLDDKWANLVECGTGRDPDGIHTGKRDRIIREFPYGIQPGHF
jgi:hypothetical protein